MGKATVRLRLGVVVLFETCGGGGHGSPAHRPADRVARDREEGYVE
jgi:N-methylhydantoinase B/oxoprolinase/acetone carboxylase alpha subunit